MDGPTSPNEAPKGTPPQDSERAQYQRRGDVFHNAITLLIIAIFGIALIGRIIVRGGLV